MRTSQTIDINNPQGINFVWQKGDTIDLTLDLVDNAGDAVDLTYFQCDFIARTLIQGAKVINLTLGNGLSFINNSSLRLYIDDSQNTYKEGRYDIRLRIRNLNNETTTVTKGLLCIE